MIPERLTFLMNISGFDLPISLIYVPQSEQCLISSEISLSIPPLTTARVPNLGNQRHLHLSKINKLL